MNVYICGRVNVISHLCNYMRVVPGVWKSLEMIPVYGYICFD